MTETTEPVADKRIVKPGKTTTEWYVTLASVAAGLLLMFKGDPEQAKFGQQLVAVAVAAYPVSRGLAKAGG